MAGFARPSYSLFSVNTPLGTWQGGVITIAMLLAFVTGLVLLLPGNRKIRYADAYTCGVSDLDGDEANAASQNMYESAASLVKKLHSRAIVPVFGNGEEVQE